MEKGKIIDWVKNNVSTWIDEQTINTLFNNDKLIECINKCTSPRKSKLNEQINEDDLKLIFNAFSLFKPEDTRVLIIGQDPYPAEGKAHGFSFSVLQEYTKHHSIDASLLNIFKAIKVYKDKDNIKRYFCDINKDEVQWGTNLKDWASTNQVLLLNTALTYGDKNKNKNLTKEQKEEIQKIHFNAWEPFIQLIISNLIKSKLSNSNKEVAVFLWGVPAQQLFFKSVKDEIFNELSEDEQKKFNKKKLIHKEGPIKINNNIEIFLTSHPSNAGQAVKQGFCYEAPKHFATCDEFLDKGKKEKNKLNTWLNFPEKNK